MLERCCKQYVQRFTKLGSQPKIEDPCWTSFTLIYTQKRTESSESALIPLRSTSRLHARTQQLRNQAATCFMHTKPAHVFSPRVTYQRSCLGRSLLILQQCWSYETQSNLVGAPLSCAWKSCFHVLPIPKSSPDTPTKKPLGIDAWHPLQGNFNREKFRQKSLSKQLGNLVPRLHE